MERDAEGHEGEPFLHGYFGGERPDKRTLSVKQEKENRDLADRWSGNWGQEKEA